MKMTMTENCDTYKAEVQSRDVTCTIQRYPDDLYQPYVGPAVINTRVQLVMLEKLTYDKPTVHQDSSPQTAS